MGGLETPPSVSPSVLGLPSLLCRGFQFRLSSFVHAVAAASGRPSVVRAAWSRDHAAAKKVAQASRLHSERRGRRSTTPACRRDACATRPALQNGELSLHSDFLISACFRHVLSETGLAQALPQKTAKTGTDYQIAKRSTRLCRGIRGYLAVSPRFAQSLCYFKKCHCDFRRDQGI